MYLPIFITATLVSLDALFVGMSLKLQKNFKLLYLYVIAAVILTISITAFFVAGAFAEYINFDATWMVGGAFVLLGIRNLFAKDEDAMALTIGTVVVLGLVMSIDGAVATVALTIEEGKTFLTPVIVSAGHLLFLLLGSFTIRFIQTSHKVHNIISASCLFLIAVFNFTGVL